MSRCWRKNKPFVRSSWSFQELQRCRQREVRSQPSTIQGWNLPFTIFQMKGKDMWTTSGMTRIIRKSHHKIDLVIVTSLSQTKDIKSLRLSIRRLRRKDWTEEKRLNWGEKIELRVVFAPLEPDSTEALTFSMANSMKPFSHSTASGSPESGSDELSLGELLYDPASHELE